MSTSKAINHDGTSEVGTLPCRMTFGWEVSDAWLEPERLLGPTRCTVPPSRRTAVATTSSTSSRSSCSVPTYPIWGPSAPSLRGDALWIEQTSTAFLTITASTAYLRCHLSLSTSLHTMTRVCRVSLSS